MATGILQLADQRNPTGQTFVVPTSCTLTAIGLFFAKCPDTDAHGITLEMRPTTESGAPSSKRYIPGTRVSATAAQIRAKTDPGGSFEGNTFSSAREFKFDFDEPVFVPANSLVSFVVYTSAPAGQYQMYVAKRLDFLYGSTEEFYTFGTSTERGAYYASSNGTSWEADNNKDVTFKVYQAQFATNTLATAILQNNTPGVKKLTETTLRDGLHHFSFDPLTFTKNSGVVKVHHPAHGFLVGDQVTLTSDGTNSFDSTGSLNGIAGSALLGTKTITGIDPFGYTFNSGGSADSAVRAGGTGLFATENYRIDQAHLQLPYETPNKTAMSVKANFTTSTSYAGNETPHNTTSNIRLRPGETVRMKDPHVILSEDNETLHLSGNPSAQITVQMWTDNESVAPHFNVDTATLTAEHALIDNAAAAVTPGKNTLVSTDYVAETQPDGGSDAAKHISVPYKLETSATSILVIVDAARPNKSEFSVWFRTRSSADENAKLEDVSWTEFDKNAKQSKGRAYSEIAADDNYSRFREYEFSVFNLNAFDEYQIKITFNTQRQTYPPVFRNLRTIATS
tara:strand:- start:1749 stop:3446 length:1698 start_codon:yes stop_codon:yes gene_type:complete